MIEIFTDGSATTGKPGGYGWVMVIDGVKYSEGSGHAENVTNNDMELLGAIQGLTEALKYETRPINVLGEYEVREIVPHEVVLCSDSQIVLGWASGQYRFTQQDKIEKYNQLKFLVKRLSVKTKWIKAHSGHEHNERCDKLANNARKGIPESLDKPTVKADTKIGIKKTGVLCVWYGDVMKVIDLENNLVENFNRDIHGKRGTVLQIREEKSR